MNAEIEIVILYGSQTGVSKMEAEYLACEISLVSPVSPTVKISSFEKFDFAQLIEVNYLVCFVSTTGYGDFSSDTIKFWNQLTLDFPSDCFEDLNIAVFGFGDSSYAKFNHAAKLLFTRFTQIGAKAILELGLGNDSDEFGYFQTLIQWKQIFFDRILKTNFDSISFDKMIYRSIEINSRRTPNQKSIDDDSQKIDTIFMNSEQNHQIGNQEPSKLIRGSVFSNKLLTSPEHFQSVKKLSFFTEKKIKFRAGDCVSLYFQNSSQNVIKLAPYIDRSLDAEIKISSATKLQKIAFKFTSQSPISVRNLLEDGLDFMRPMNYYFFKSLSEFCPEDVHKSRIIEMTFEDYYSYVVKERRVIWEIFFDFKIQRVPFDLILNFCPKIRGREYSIASSPFNSNDQIDIIYAVVDYLTPFKSLFIRKSFWFVHQFFRFARKGRYL